MSATVRYFSLVIVCGALNCAAPSVGTREQSGEGSAPPVLSAPAGSAISRVDPIIDPRTEPIRVREGVVRVDSLPFEYSAKTRLVTSRLGPNTGTAIEVAVTAVNRGTQPVKVQYGACAIELFAYRIDVSTAAHVWRSSRRSPWPGGFAYGCPLYLAEAVVQPGATFQPKEFTASFPVSELLADSLPDGMYHFAARIRLNWGESREITAGRLTLSLERGELPSSRLAGAITYEARPATARGAKELVFAGAATLTHAGSSRYEISPACGMQVLAYRDRNSRDKLPPVRESWRSLVQPCGPVVQVTLQCGESYHFESRVSPLRILGDSLPSGDYYFAVVLKDQRHSVRLAAGSATLNRDTAVARRDDSPLAGTSRDGRMAEHCARRVPSR